MSGSERSKDHSSSTRHVSENAEGREEEPLPGAQESDVPMKETKTRAAEQSDSSTKREEKQAIEPKPLAGDSSAGSKCCLLL
jgi:hypothetical protein